MTNIQIRRYPITLRPQDDRVIIRPFFPGVDARATAIIGRVLALTEEEVEETLGQIRAEFSGRHRDIEKSFCAHFQRAESHLFTQRTLTPARQLLIGACFSGEYSLEAAALFNPSMVPHPDQEGVQEGALRFIMSLRATGEGHISSIEFRTGEISAAGEVSLDPVSPFATAPDEAPNPSYRKRLFAIKLHEMGLHSDCAREVLAPLGESFTGSELTASVDRVRSEHMPPQDDTEHTLACVQWLADSNYEINFSPELDMSERIIFPVSTIESCGIEDARFVRFADDDGAVTYFATYTAYSGHDILPQLMETTDFLHFRVLTLNGSAAHNKGMAMFPRRIDGCYVMLSRQDDENLFIMSSDNPHYWSNPTVLLRPAEIWESVKVGNCGSPIETEAGWLLITHGVGPMRKYCIGAALLDLNDPARVIGRLREPLLTAEGEERNGYVPNVVYSCGGLSHGREILLPYALSDTVTTIAAINLDDLLRELGG